MRHRITGLDPAEESTPRMSPSSSETDATPRVVRESRSATSAPASGTGSTEANSSSRCVPVLLEGWDKFQQDAENAPALMPGGQVLAIMSAKGTQRAAIRLCTQVRPEMRVKVVLLAFTLDRYDVVDAFCEAAARGVRVHIGVDKQHTEKSELQCASLQRLLEAGCDIFLMSGVDIRAEYEDAGRPGVRPGTGHQHAKYLRIGNIAICGSTNWTTSSRCNNELSLLVELSSEQEAFVYKAKEKMLFDDLFPVTREYLEQLRMRFVNVPRTRSSSRPASRARSVTPSGGRISQQRSFQTSVSSDLSPM